MSRSSVDDHAARLERALVGEVFYRPARLAECAAIVTADDFVDIRAAAIWRALVALGPTLTGGEPDTLALEGALARAGDLALVGGLHGLADIVGQGISSCLAVAHARQVAEAAEARRLRLAAGRAAEALATGVADASEAAEALRSAADHAATRLAPDDDGAPDALLRAFFADAEAGQSGGRATLRPAVSSAIDDNVLVPLGAGEMLILGARPGRGKSHFAGDLAFGWARAGHRGVILTAEDAPEVWVAREVAKVTALDVAAFREARPTVRDWTARIEHHDAIEAIGRLPLTIASIVGRRASEVGGRMRREAARGARFAVVDYAQLVRPSRPLASRADEVASVVSDLLDAAIHAKLALVLVSQLHRTPAGTRGEPRPGMQNLRASGTLEERATAIVLIWRPSVRDYSRCVLIREKWKHGPAGDVTWEGHWLPHARRFTAVSGPRAVEEDRG